MRRAKPGLPLHIRAAGVPIIFKEERRSTDDMASVTKAGSSSAGKDLRRVVIDVVSDTV